MISLLIVDFTDQIKEYFQQQLKRNLFLIWWYFNIPKICEF